MTENMKERGETIQAAKERLIGDFNLSGPDCPPGLYCKINGQWATKVFRADLGLLLAELSRLEGENERLSDSHLVKAFKGLMAFVAGLRRQRDELHATTNRYLDRARSAETALADARRQIAEAREAFLNFVADAKKFEQDIDGEYEDGRSVVTIRYDIETEHHGLWELIDALGFKHKHDETPFDAVCREIEEAPVAALTPSEGAEG